MKLYIFTCTKKGHETSHISQEGYRTLKECQSFIASRSGHPKQISDFEFEDKNYLYKIYEILIN